MKLTPALLLTLCACATAQKPGEEPVPLSQSSAAQRLAPVRAKAEAMIKASAHDFASLGPDASVVLQQIANDPAAYPEQRRGALTGLASVDAKTAESFARDEQEPLELRLAAARGLVESAAPPSRIAAATLIGHLGGPGAREALEGRLEHEEDPQVREALQKALTVLQP